MTKGIEAIRARMQDIEMRCSMTKIHANPVTNKEKSLLDTLEICEEIYARGYQISNVNLYKSLADEFTIDPDNAKALIPPFTVIDGLGAGVASSIVEAAKQAEFLSKEDLEKRTQLSGTLIKKLDMMGVLNGLSDRNQMSLF
jgi:DNA polymerase-3 subunit alpha (Gram-positive type)